MQTRTTSEQVLGASGAGTVVLDIGGDYGALVIWAPASLEGSELEIRPVGTPWRGEHTAVRPRDVGAGRRQAAVFACLTAGRYELRVRGTETAPLLDAHVSGGSIAELSWPPPGARA